MKAAFLLGAVLLAASVFAVSGQDLVGARRNLMPVPHQTTWETGRLAVDKNFKFAVVGPGGGRLDAYVSRVLRRLEGRTVLELARAQSDAGTAALLIEVGAPGDAIPRLGDDESYTLKIDSQRARITAPNSVGAMRGLETMLQLLERDRDGFYFPAVDIRDKPRFPWRGLMIDSARHFQPVEVIKRNLDAMSAVKLNVMHWHLTDDQGFRVESRRLPELHLLGSNGDFYTQEQIRDVIAYAAARGIRVMPEFDVPGHATSWLVSHPEIGSAPGPYKIETLPGIFDPTLDPTNERTYKILETFFAEMAPLFPDAYLHIGGDENEGKQWNANPKIQAFMKENGIKDNHQLQTYFNKRLLKFIQKNGKIMMGWDEIFQPDLPKDVVIHSWRGQKALAEAARQGFTGVLSNGYYIDLMQPASDHYTVDPLPAGTDLTPEQQKRVLGGEATMWSEWVSPETIDSRIWPRTAAIAERFWSPREVNEVDDMYRRLAVIEMQLEELGLTHLRNQPMMMRRLTNGADIGPLKTLVDLIEPVKIYQRYQQRPQTMLSPLTGLIDIARADAPDARRFNKFIGTLVAEKSCRENASGLATIFERWTRAGTDLEPLMAGNPGLAEARRLGADLRELGEIGSEFVRGLAPGGLTAEWRDSKAKRLDEIAKPKAALEFQVIGSMKKLVSGACEK